MTNGGGMTLSNRADNPIAIGGKKLTKQISEEWEIDEDDYCVLTSPTTSKVVSHCRSTFNVIRHF